MGQPTFIKPSSHEANVIKIGKGVWACQVLECWAASQVKRTVTSVTIKGNRKAARQVARNLLELHNIKEGGET